MCSFIENFKVINLNFVSWVILDYQCTLTAYVSLNDDVH